MKVLALALALVVGCGGGQHPDAGSADPVPVYKDTRSPIEKRRDLGCEALQPKLTQCALADAKATMSPKELAELKPEELLAKHKAVFLKQCESSAMSSRQVRVLEVCNQQESACDPLAECLKNLEPQKREPAR